jgi:hypothetical protein
MAEHNPYSAPQITEQIVKTTVAPLNRRQRQHPWEEPLRTKLSDIARLQQTLVRSTPLLLAVTVGITAWIITQQRDWPLSGGEWLLLGLLMPGVGLLGVIVYRLVALLDDGDSPAFVALSVLVPYFNLLLIFYYSNVATGYLRESGIASGWTGISAEQFAAQVELLREAEQGKQPAGLLPVAEEIR